MPRKVMNVFEIRSKVIARAQELIAEKNLDCKDWEISCSLDTFEFDCEEDEYMENYIRYRVSNHELRKANHIHHQIHEGEHHCWWYNFDDLFDTKSDEEVIEHLAQWLVRLIENQRELAQEDSNGS